MSFNGGFNGLDMTPGSLICMCEYQTLSRLACTANLDIQCIGESKTITRGQ